MADEIGVKVALLLNQAQQKLNAEHGKLNEGIVDLLRSTQEIFTLQSEMIDAMLLRIEAIERQIPSAGERSQPSTSGPAVIHDGPPQEIRPPMRAMLGGAPFGAGPIGG